MSSSAGLGVEIDAEHAAQVGDGRLLAGVERAAHDQVVAGARHADVLQPARLLALGLTLGSGHFGVAERWAQEAVAGSTARSAMRPPESTRMSRVCRDARVAAAVGQRHHVELEPLGRVHRHEHDRVARPPRRSPPRPRAPAARPARRRSARTPPGRGRAPPRSRPPGDPACAGWRSGGRRRASPGRPGRSRARPRSGRSRRSSDTSADARTSRANRCPNASASRRSSGVRPGGGSSRSSGGEDRPPDRRATHAPEAVVRHPDERRGQHRQQRDVVVAVADQAQVGEHVATPAAGRSSRGRWRAPSAGGARAAPSRSGRRRCRPRTASPPARGGTRRRRRARRSARASARASTSRQLCPAWR